MTTKKAAPPTNIRDLYVREPIYHDFTLDRGDGQKPLVAAIQVNLPFSQLSAIPTGAGIATEAVMAAIAPFIRSWNLTATNRTTGKEEPLPPPLEAGPDVLHFLEIPELVWIVDRCRNGWQVKRYSSADFTPKGEEDAA